ncbi:MAG TPA: phosphoenolpyruvate carboxykinase (ATP), partial [Dehalococcoidia bacterium]|nr:phosphoenolpyruvate carboxykinase (ATP) [Dehalococcoidia bacterium]
YTARVAGTEMGLGSQPAAVFSPCFGAPFLALLPMKYTNLLLNSIRRYGVKCWMVNTGWIKGGYGKGERISLPYTRALINAAIEGKLDPSKFVTDKNFGFSIVSECPGIPSEVLIPAKSWPSEDKYNEQAQQLAKSFATNLKEMADVPSEITQSGPHVS